MGNSTSTQQSHYENYISQQQAQIAAQQQQIDRLFQMTLNSQRSTIESHAQQLSENHHSQGYVPTNVNGEILVSLKYLLNTYHKYKMQSSKTET